MTHSEKSYTKESPKKPVRSSSGVTPLTVVLKPRKCDHGTCIYCPGGEHVPQSYTDKSPAIMRALALKFDPYIQVQKRLEVLKKMGHPTDKIEIIVLGGTFLQYELEYQYDFIKKCFDALNQKSSKSLEEAKKINETAEHRCVALCIENRPDNCSPSEIQRMLEFGCTRVEIGVQIPDDEVYKKINRGHTVQAVIDATLRLKNAGFKVGYHYMPGLPHSTKEKDFKLFKKLFDSEDFRPDQLKIYPCQIVDDSPLAKTHEILKYKPYTTEETKEFLNKTIPLIPEYCRIMRIMREIPKEKMLTEPIRLDIRKDIEENLKKQGIKINEIRMREIGFTKSQGTKNLKLKIITYNASKGKEYFLEIVDSNDTLYGLLRLRILPEKDKKTSMVRELHVYGKALDLGKEGKTSQHIGLGKQLMSEAENISIKNSCKIIKVISGVGVREYYKKLGYVLDKEKIYMEKVL
jgi:elongator complex protein 3